MMHSVGKLQESLPSKRATFPFLLWLDYLRQKLFVLFKKYRLHCRALLENKESTVKWDKWERRYSMRNLNV